MTTLATHLTIPSQTPLEEYVRQSVCETVTLIGAGEVLPTATGCHDERFDGVCGIIPIGGDLVCSFVLGLPRRTATQLVATFAGCDIEYDSPDMGDAVGELANILAGDFIARLDAAGVSASISIPMVARGHDDELLLPTDYPAFRIAFTTPAGPFWTKLATVQPGRS
jgi:CheY-specific phosphatase CheX